MSNVMKASLASVLPYVLLVLAGCNPDVDKNGHENTPTAGYLKVCYDEGLRLHVQNQAETFQALYPKVHLDLAETNDHAAVQALFNDSCEAIVISRPLGDQEKKAFASRQYTPSFSRAAVSGVAVLSHSSCAVRYLTLDQIRGVLLQNSPLTDSSGEEHRFRVLFDRSNSSVLRYLTDSILKSKDLSPNCGVLGSTLESINFVATHPGSLAFIDFAWISDVDDSISKSNRQAIRVLPILNRDGIPETPNQSSFKLGTYPLARSVYIYRKVGDFTLAKGFESFVAGPKGQLIFLKQGLLPTRQSERNISIKIGIGSSP